MSESLSWFKLGARSRTPTAPLSACSMDQNVEYRRPGSSRLSTYSSRVSPTGSDYERARELAQDDRTIPSDLGHRGADQTWYNPSLDQMAEALQVFLMTHGAFVPIPLEYNSYVSYLVEGFAKARETVRKVETAYEASERTLEKNLEQFKQVADEWRERESQYRAEVKRLEVLLSKPSRDGIQAVVLARAGSVVERKGVDDGFRSRLDQFATRRAASRPKPLGVSEVPDVSTWQPQDVEACHAATKPSPLKQGPVARILDDDYDFLMSERFRQQDAATGAFAHVFDYRAGRRRNISGLRATRTATSDKPQHSPCDPSETAATNCDAGPRTPSAAESYVPPEFPGCIEAGTHVSDTVGEEPSPGQRRRHSRFSFEAGDDHGGLLDRPMAGDNRDSADTWRQGQYEMTDPPGLGTCQTRANSATSVTAVAECSSRSSPPSIVEDSSASSSSSSSRPDPHPVAAAHTEWPVRRNRDANKPSVAATLPNQESRPGTQQQQQRTADALIAASRAMSPAGCPPRTKSHPREGPGTA